MIVLIHSPFLTLRSACKFTRFFKTLTEVSLWIIHHCILYTPFFYIFLLETWPFFALPCDVCGFIAMKFEMWSSGLWHHVAIKIVYSILEEPAAPVYRIEVKIQKVDFSIMFVTVFLTKQCHNPEDRNPTWIFISVVGFEIPTAVTMRSMLFGMQCHVVWWKLSIFLVSCLIYSLT